MPYRTFTHQDAALPVVGFGLDYETGEFRKHVAVPVWMYNAKLAACGLNDALRAASDVIDRFFLAEPIGINRHALTRLDLNDFYDITF